MAKVGLWDKELNTIENVASAWPMILIGLGGLLGGLFGALAWYLNVKVMKSYVGIVAYPAVLLIGLAAWVAYFGVVILLVLQFPELAAR